MRRKRLLLCIVLFVLLCAPLVVSVDAASMWSRTYGGVAGESASSVIETPDGGYAIAGLTTSFGAGQLDFWLVKTNALGDMEWNRTYGGASDDVGRELIMTSDGGYAITGPTYSFGAGLVDFWLVKTGALGNMQWNQTYGGTGFDEAYSVVATSDGGYAIAGYTTSFGAGDGDFWLVKTDALGNMQWNQTYGGTSFDWASSLVATSDGGYAIAGLTESFGAGARDFWLVKTNSLGDMEWNRTYGGTVDDAAYSVVATSDGGYAIAGYIEAVTEADAWLVKTDSLGNMQWNQTYEGIGNDASRAHSLVATSDGGYAIAGYMSYRPVGYPGGIAFWLVKTDALGITQWNQTYGETGEMAWSLVATSDGGYAIAGYTNSFGAGGSDFWLVKTDEFGVVPEYSSLLVPALVLTATAFILINKKTVGARRSESDAEHLI